MEEAILKLLEEKATLKQLLEKSKSGISGLYLILESLKSKGYLISEGYEEDGKILFLNKSLETNKKITIPVKPQLRFLILSDTHLGRADEKIITLEKLYEYADKKNVDVILHLGDLMEGIINLTDHNYRLEPMCKNIFENVEYAVNRYPINLSILTMILFGNHDYYAVEKMGYDAAGEFAKRRLDILSLGYQKAELSVGNLNVLLHHPFLKQLPVSYDLKLRELSPHMNDQYLVFRGHMHEARIYRSNIGNRVVQVPSLYPRHADNIAPGAWEVVMYFDHEKIAQMEYKLLTFYPKIATALTLEDVWNPELVKKIKR